MIISNASYEQFLKLRDLIDQGHFDVDGKRPEIKITIVIE